MAFKPNYEVFKSDIDGNEIQPLVFEKVNYKRKTNKIPTFYFTMNRNYETELSAPTMGDKVKIIRNYQPVFLGEIENVEVRENTFFFEGRSIAKEFENFVPLSRQKVENNTVKQHIDMMEGDISTSWDTSNVSTRHTISSFQYNYENYINRFQAIAEMKNLNFKFNEMPREIHFDTIVGKDRSGEIVLSRGKNFDEIKVNKKKVETWDFVIALGKGDGKNQLMTTAGNSGNRTKTKVFTDKQIENMSDLQDFADEKLEEGNQPEHINYEMRIDNSLFNFDLGDALYVEDFKNGIDESLRAYEIDVTFNETEQVDVVLANRRNSLASFLKNLEKGQRTLENVQHSSAVQAGAMIQVDEDYNPVQMEVQNNNFINTSSGKSIGDIEDEIASKESTIVKQPTAPSNPEDGDLWLDLGSSPNLLKRWNASQNDWVRTSAMTAEEIGAESMIYRQPTAPTDLDALWLDTSNSPNVLKRHDGTNWIKATPTNADEISETGGKKWAGESGADITGNNTANDTANVNGIPAGTVQGNAQAGRDAKTKLEQEVANKIIETVEGATAKADAAKQDAINSAVQSANSYTDNQAVAQSEYDSKVASIDSAVDSNSTSITSNSNEIATKASQTEVNDLGNRMDSAETSITQNSDNISLKASQSEVDTISGDLSTAQSNISINSDNISTKVEQTDFNNLTGRVDSAETSISQNSDAIALKASQSALDDATGRITSNESELSVQSGQIATKVEQTEFNNLSIGGRNLMEGTTDEFKSITFGGWDAYFSDVSAKVKEGDELTARMYVKPQDEDVSVMLDFRNEAGDYKQYKGNVISAGQEGYTQVTATIDAGYDSQVRMSRRHSSGDTPSATVEYKEVKLEKGNRATDWTPAPEDTENAIANVDAKVTTNETNITQNSDQIALKASQTDVDNIEGRVSTAESNISVNTNNISSKVEQTDFNSVEDRVTTAESNITQNSDSISSKVEQTDFDSLEGRMTSAESSITQQSNEIDLRVRQDAVISSINQTAESIKIQASNIDLVGAVTLTSMDTSTKTMVQNGDSAKTKIDNEVGSNTLETTTGSQSKADSAESSAKSFFQKEAWKYSGYWNIGTTSEGHDFVFPAIPSKFHDYMNVRIYQYDLEAQVRIKINGTVFVSAINGADGVTEWKEFSIPSSSINPTSDNTIRIEHNGSGSGDWGDIYKVEIEFDSKSYTENWSEQGADVTANNTANDTSKVNGTSASTVKNNANAGKSAKDKLDSDVGSNTVESTNGAQSKADNAEKNAKELFQKEAWMYDLGDSGEYYSDGESHDFVFPPIPSKYHNYMRVKLLQHEMESGFNIYENGTLLVDGVNGTNETKEWNEFDLVNADLNSTSNNTITVEREAGSADGGTLYKVQLEIDHQKYAQDMRDEAKDDVENGNVTLPTSALSGAINVATNNIQQDSNFYWDTSGFYAIDPNNSNRIVRITSGGIGISENGGTSYSTAMSGDGIVADVITAGFMQMDRLKGGTLQLGGSGNGNGLFRVFDDDGEKIAELDANNRGFKRLQIGDVVSDSVVKVNNYDLTFKVHPDDGDDDNIVVDAVGGANGQSWDYPAKTIQAVIDALPTYNSGDITIEVKYGYGKPIYENISFGGFFGAGQIKIDFADNEVQGWIETRNCTQKIIVDRLTLNGAGTTYAGIYCSKAMHFSFTNSVIYGDNSSISYGVYVGDNSYAWIDNVDMYEFDYACVRAAYGSMAVVRDCKGLASYGMYAQYNSTIGGAGTAPDGSTANTRVYGGGDFNGDWTSYDSGTATPPAPPETTQTWTSTSAGAWRPNFGGQWNEEYPIQGEWNGYGLYKGMWFFPSDMWNTLEGKTITRIRAYIKRKSEGGYSSSQTVVVRHHVHTSKPSGEPTVSGEYINAEMKWGEGKWITLPSSFHNNFGGTDRWGKGICVYTNNTSNTDYMKFDEVAKIEVTYS